MKEVGFVPHNSQIALCLDLSSAEQYFSDDFGSCMPSAVDFQGLSVFSSPSTGQETLFQDAGCGALDVEEVHSRHLGADFHLKDDVVLNEVFSVVNRSLLGSFPFSPALNFSLNLFQSSVSISVSGRKDAGGMVSCAVPNISSQPVSLPALQEKASVSVFDPGDKLLDSVVNTAPLVTGYNLRSSAKKGAGGLGKGKSPSARGRGRIFFLEKAQDRAMLDVHDGRQISIDRALRASHSLKPGV